MANFSFPIEIRIVFQRGGEAEISLSTTSHNIFFPRFFWDKYQVDQSKAAPRVCTCCLIFCNPHSSQIRLRAVRQKEKLVRAAKEQYPLHATSRLWPQCRVVNKSTAFFCQCTCRQFLSSRQVARVVGRSRQGGQQCGYISRQVYEMHCCILIMIPALFWSEILHPFRKFSTPKS